MVTFVKNPDTVLPSGDHWVTDIGSIRLRFGAGRLDELPAAVRELGGRRVLLVTDEGLEACGHPQRAAARLSAAGLQCVVFGDVAENPSDEALCRAVRDLAGRDIDFVVALGGGSVMDAAKGINFLLTNGGRVEDFWGYGRACTPLLPAIALPTTGGTGSDAQSYAVISQDGTHRKMACGDPTALFREVILDPDLALTAPDGTVAAAGMDALSHALESHVTRTRTEDSGRLSTAAWRLLDASLETCFAETAEQRECRGNMLAGAHLAGAAIEASMLGAAHAAANPLTAGFGLTHGVAVGLMLPQVVRFNGEVADRHYRELDPGGAVAIARRVEAVRDTVGLPASLGDCGVGRKSLRDLAQLATQEWTGTHNPRPLTETDFLELYEAAY